MANAKGSTLIGAVKVLRKQKEKARELLAPELHQYLEDRVSQAAWYPEEHLIGLIKAAIELIPGHRDAVLEGMGIATAHALGEGVYSHLIEKGGSVSSTFALWASMHDSGKLSVERGSGNVVTFRLSGYEHPCPEMCGIIGAYMQETLRMGGRDATLEKTTCVLSGDDDCSWKGTW